MTTPSLDYAGHLPTTTSGTRPSQRLLDLDRRYVARIRPGHAAVKMAEVEAHLSDTFFAWMGGVDADSVFYYRVQSPVILIEFDHQSGVVFDNDEPTPAPHPYASCARRTATTTARISCDYTTSSSTMRPPASAVRALTRPRGTP